MKLQHALSAAAAALLLIAVVAAYWSLRSDYRVIEARQHALETRLAGCVAADAQLQAAFEDIGQHLASLRSLLKQLDSRLASNTASIADQSGDAAVAEEPERGATDDGQNLSDLLGDLDEFETENLPERFRDVAMTTPFLWHPLGHRENTEEKLLETLVSHELLPVESVEDIPEKVRDSILSRYALFRTRLQVTELEEEIVTQRYIAEATRSGQFADVPVGQQIPPEVYAFDGPGKIVPQVVPELEVQRVFVFPGSECPEWEDLEQHRWRERNRFLVQINGVIDEWEASGR